MTGARKHSGCGLAAPPFGVVWPANAIFLPALLLAPRKHWATPALAHAAALAPLLPVWRLLRQIGPTRPKSFEPFFTTKEKGPGLGLAISRSIATAHGGRLWGENIPNGGATFHLELPTDISNPLPEVPRRPNGAKGNPRQSQPAHRQPQFTQSTMN